MMSALELPATWRNNSMQKLTLIVALCFCQIVWAAENALPVQDVDESTTEDVSEQTETGQDSELELVPAEQELILADIEQRSEAEEESSNRFIPTEQISQDLGVSFPVDI